MDPRTRKRRMATVVATTLAITATMMMLPSIVGEAGASTPPGSNGKIAFTRDDPSIDGHWTFTIDPDGTHEIELPVQAGCPGWSPDSTKLLVCSPNAAGYLRPAVSNPDGSGFTLLDAHPNRRLPFECGLWSPDGTRFLCTSDNRKKPSNGIYTLRSSDGGDVRRVTTAPAGLSDFPVGYSTNGSKILFLRNDPNGNWGDLFVVNPDGTGMVRLNPPGMLVLGSNFDGAFGFDSCCGPNADWSPDGSLIAFGAMWKPSSHYGSQFAVFVVRPNGRGLHRITPRGIGAGRNHVRFSPDGQEIAFATRLGGIHYPEVWVVRPDGSGLTKLTMATNLDISVGPVWSPDGTQLVFQSYHPEINGGQEDLWVINADGTGLRRLTSPVDGLIGEAQPSWGSAPVG